MESGKSGKSNFQKTEISMGSVQNFETTGEKIWSTVQIFAGHCRSTTEKKIGEMKVTTEKNRVWAFQRALI